MSARIGRAYNQPSLAEELPVKLGVVRQQSISPEQ